MQDFPSNSQKAKAPDAPREKLEPVTSAETVRRRKKGLGRKFKQTFFGGSARGAAEDTVAEVIVPAIRDLVFESLHNTIDRLIYGDRVSRPRRPSGIITNQPTGRVNYGQYSSPQQTQATQRTVTRKHRAHHDMSELVVPTRDEANAVLDRMYDILSQSGDVQVAHLYELTGIRPEFTDQKFGWTSLKGAKAVPLRQGGFYLDLPEPEVLG